MIKIDDKGQHWRQAQQFLDERGRRLFNHRFDAFISRQVLDRMADHFLIGSYDLADFALRLSHKDVSLACQLARDVGVPMRLTTLAHQELTEALGRRWGARDSRVGMLLQQERAGIAPLAIPAEKLKAVLAADKQ